MSELTREQVADGMLTREQLDNLLALPFHQGTPAMREGVMELLAHDGAQRKALAQQAQEIERLKDKWAERRANLIEHYEGEIARLEGELESHAWEISPAMAQAKIDELNQQLAAMRTERDQQAQEIERLRSCKADDERGQLLNSCGHSTYWVTNYSTCMACRAEHAEAALAAMTREREAMRDKTDFYKAEIDRADVLLNRFGIPNIAHECGDMLKPVDERIELVFVQMDAIKQQLAASQARVKELEVVCTTEHLPMIEKLTKKAVQGMYEEDVAKLQATLAAREAEVRTLHKQFEVIERQHDAAVQEVERLRTCRIALEVKPE